MLMGECVVGGTVVEVGLVGRTVAAGQAEHCASTVRLLGEQTWKGTWASAHTKAQQGL